MTDAKTMTELSDPDLDQAQGGGIAVGNPGEKKDVVSDDLTASAEGGTWSRVLNDKSYDVGD